MKKIVSAFAAAAVMSSCVFWQSVSANVDSLQRETARSSAEEFVSRYYCSMYTDSEIDLYGRAAYEEMGNTGLRLRADQVADMQVCCSIKHQGMLHCLIVK